MSTRAAPIAGRLRARLGGDDGFTMITVMGFLMVAMLFSVAAITAASGDLAPARIDQDRKEAYAAAEAGLNDYLFHLNDDTNYWAKCDNVPGAAASAVNQRNDTAPFDNFRVRPVSGPRTSYVKGSRPEYALELLPANGNTTCSETMAENSMIDSSTGTFRVRSTGRVRGKRRSIVATFRRRGFLDYLYFTDYETSDPVWYAISTAGKQTRTTVTNPETVEAWAARACTKYWYQGRGNEGFVGEINSPPWTRYPSSGTIRCSEIQFAGFDAINGPFHTNDEILVCGGPVFGRSGTQDIVEVTGPAAGTTGAGWRGCSGSAPVFNGQMAPNLATQRPRLDLPLSNSALKTAAQGGGVLYTGKTIIRLQPGSANMLVTNTAAGLNNASVALPANGVVYVQNGTCGSAYAPYQTYTTPDGCAEVRVSGTYARDLTIGSDQDIVIDGNILRDGDRVLGLIAEQFVRVAHKVDYNTSGCPNLTSAPYGTMTTVTIDAAILALNHSFTVDNYFCGAKLGQLIVNGAIAQKYRGPVGTGGSTGTGYEKKYNYDNRLRYRSPPKFLDPVQTSWRVQRQSEQVPAR